MINTNCNLKTIFGPIKLDYLRYIKKQVKKNVNNCMIKVIENFEISESKSLHIYGKYFILK